MMKNNLIINTKHHETSSLTRLGADFVFTESGHLILPMKGQEEYITQDEALRLAKFIFANVGTPFIASLNNSCDQLRKVIPDYPIEDEGLKKHNLHYVNRIESITKKLTEY